MEPSNDGQMEPRPPIWEDLLPVLRRRRNLIMVVFVATVLGAYTGLQLTTERYDTEARLLVKLGRENAEAPATVRNGGFFTSGVRREELNSEIQILTSPSLIEGVVDEVGPPAFRFAPAPPRGFLPTLRYYVKKSLRWVKERGRDVLVLLNLKKQLTDREEAIMAVERALSAGPEKDSDVIGLRLRFPDPDLGVRVLDTLIRHYRDHHVRVRQDVVVKEFFEQQVDSLQGQLQAMDAAGEELRSRLKLSSVSEQRSLLLERLSEARQQVDANRSESAMLQRQQAVMRERLSALPSELRRSQVVTRNPSIQSIKERITGLQVERAKLLSGYTPESQVVRNVDEELAQLAAVLAGEETSLLGSVTSEVHPVKQEFSQSIEEIEVKLAGLAARTATLRMVGAGLEAQLRELDLGEIRLGEILRERKIAEQSYSTYAQRREEARISEELDRRRIANVSVLAPPTSGIEPAYPRKILVMGLAFPLGLLLGFGLALLLEYADDRVCTSRDVAEIKGLSYLGTLRLPSGPAMGASANP